MTTTIGDPRPAGQEGPAGDQRAPGEEGPAGDPRPAGDTATGSAPATYDPADHTVDEVNAYLANADDTERDRVLDDERNGKGRTSITG